MPIRITSVLNETIDDVIQSECLHGMNICTQPSSQQRNNILSSEQARTAMSAGLSLPQSLGQAMYRLRSLGEDTGRLTLLCWRIRALLCQILGLSRAPLHMVRRHCP